MTDHIDTDRQTWMTDDQWRCAGMIASVFGGFHHMRPFKACANGVRVLLYQTDLSTWDHDHLTALVFAAHAQCIRVSVCVAGMRLELRAHPRDPSGKGVMHRHPNLRESIARYAPEEIAP